MAKEIEVVPPDNAGAEVLDEAQWQAIAREASQILASTAATATPMKLAIA
jgi:hypothetical protein